MHDIAQLRGARGRSSGRLAVAVVALLAAGCVTHPTIRSEHDASVDFSRYGTFGFFSPVGTDRAGYETLLSRTLKASSRREMEARGYRYVESGGELLVNFNAQLADRIEVTRTPIPTSEYYGYRSYVPWRDYEVDVDQYKEGTLNIDVVDAQRKQLIWEGVAVGRVTEKTYRNREAAIDGAVTEIFSTYPVPPKD